MSPRHPPSTRPNRPLRTIAKDYQQLWKDITSTSDKGKAVRTLAEILLDKEGRSLISNLERKDAELCIEILDHGLAEHNLKTPEKQAFFIALRRLVGIHGRLPESMTITEEIAVSGEVLVSGGFADVRTGTYKGHLVAVKTMRVSQEDGFLWIRKQFCKEVVLWNALSHPNVLKLVGVQGDMDKGKFITVSEWMAHGNVMQYIRKNHANRLELLHGAAQGLKYLHGANLTHGDLKGANILMSNDNPPRACLADFGFMTMVLDPGQPMSCSAQLEGGTMVFMAPELLVPSKYGIKDPIPTPEADTYAFGLVVYQVLTGKTPFRGIRASEISLSVSQGVRPPKPEDASAIGFSDPLWSFVQRCWDGEMKLRPRIAEVVSQLERAVADWDGVMPPCAQVEGVVSASQEPTPDSKTHGGIFASSSSLGVVPGSLTVSQMISTPFDPPTTTSTQFTEPPSTEALKGIIEPFSEPPDAVVEEDRNAQNICQTSGSRARAPPFQGHSSHTTFPQPDFSSAYDPNNCGSQALYPVGTGQQPRDEILAVCPFLERGYKPPPSQLPQKKRKGFGHLERKFLSFVGLRKEPPPQPKRELISHRSPFS